jgi:hypothetical protein
LSGKRGAEQEGGNEELKSARLTLTLIYKFKDELRDKLKQELDAFLARAI